MKTQRAVKFLSLSMGVILTAAVLFSFLRPDNAQAALLTVELYKGWNMIGVVEETESDSIKNQADKQGGLDIDDGQYLWCLDGATQEWITPQPRIIKPGQGCYINSKGRSTILLPGDPRKITLTFHKGWNMISVPVETPLSKIDDAAKLKVQDGYKVWHLDGQTQQWIHPTTLIPGKGYYVVADVNYQVLLGPEQVFAASLSHVRTLDVLDWLSKEKRASAEFSLVGPTTLSVNETAVYNLKVKPSTGEVNPLRMPGHVAIAFDDSTGFAPVKPALLVFGKGMGWHNPFNLGSLEWTKAASQDLLKLLIDKMVPVPDNVIGKILDAAVDVKRIEPPELFRDDKQYDILTVPLGADGVSPASEAAVTFTLAFTQPGVHRVHVWTAIVQGSFVPSTYATYQYQFDVRVK